MAAPKMDLIFIVNGVETLVDANLHAPLKAAAEKALSQTGNTGRPLEDWELRDAQGHVLDLDQKVEDFHFPTGAKLFLNLKAGVGG